MKLIAIDDKIAEALNDGFIPLKDILSDIEDFQNDLARAERQEWLSDMKRVARSALSYFKSRLDTRVKKAQLRGYRPKVNKTNTRTRNHYKF